jgi:subtilase family serine protease
VAVVSDDLPPDLVISATAGPATGGADADIVMTDTTKNSGTGAAAASATGFYLSSNGSLSDADVFLGSRPVPRLDPGAIHSASTTLHIPAATATGWYYVLAKADSGGQVPESIETNNVKATVVIKIGPDLMVSVITTPTSLVAGAPFSVSDTTVNQGSGRAGASTTRFFLSTNTTVDTTDVLLGSRAVPELPPAGSNAGSAMLTVPAGTPGGSFYVIAQADGATVVTETSETNNNKIAPVKLGADLIASALSVPAIASIGGTISVTDSTMNQGAGAAPDSSTGFYLSANSVPDATDFFLGARSVGVLATGVTSSGVTLVQIPAGALPGSYHIVSKADWSG